MTVVPGSQSTSSSGAAGGVSVAKMGDGYGSEAHLLRYVERHRRALDAAVLGAFGIEGRIDWLDFPFDPKATWPDAEWTGIEFLRNDPIHGTGWNAILEAWSAYWPQSGTPHNWDAVGWIETSGSRELLLVEAKANVEELVSDCGAKATSSIERIDAAFDATRRALGVESSKSWRTGYYQAGNRLATWHFFTNVLRPPIPTRLLFVYFVGDRSGPTRTCPDAVASWTVPLNMQAEHLGFVFDGAHDRIRKLFLEVSPRAAR